MANTEHKYEAGDLVYRGNTLYLVDHREGPLTWDEEGIPTYLIVKLHGNEPGPYYLEAAPESHLHVLPLMERVYNLEQALADPTTKEEK